MSATKNLLVCLLLSVGLCAQAHLQWQPGEQANGPNGDVRTSVWWDPDGSGPLTERLVLGGYFTIPSVGAENLAWFDPATGLWGAFAAQPDHIVHAVAVMASGELVIAGTFAKFGLQPLSGIVIGDGQTWMSPGGGVSLSPWPYAVIGSLLPLPNGELVVGGSFHQIGGLAISGLARWDGSQWHPYPYINSPISALALRANGRLVIGGSFPGRIAEWNGQAWTTYPSSLGASPAAILAMPNGDVVATGGPNRVTLFSGATPTATAIGTTLSLGAPASLLALPNGDLLAASVLQINSTVVRGVARWDGTQWSPYAPNLTISSMSFSPGGELMATGVTPYQAPVAPVTGVGRWDGTAWHALGHGFNDAVTGLLAPASGDVIALGRFTNASGAAARRLARFDGQTWTEIVGPTGPAHYEPDCGTVDANGDAWIVFSITGTPGPGNICKWSSSGWQCVATAITNVAAVLVENDVPIVGRSTYPVGSSASIVAWTGSQWSTIGQGLDGPVHALLRRSNGELIAGGEFLFSGTTSVSRIARFDGTAWQPLGPGFDGPVRALAELPNGDLIAAGHFINDGTLVSPLNLVARWDGSQWHMLDQGLAGPPGVCVRVIQVLPDGDVLVGGDFETANGVPAPGAARWDGTVWSAVDGGVDGEVLAVAQRSNGELLVGGNFAIAGAESSAHLARLVTNSPATVVPVGAGCSTSVGLLQLATTQLPWLGSSYRAASAPVAANSIGIDVYGLAATQQPLSALLPVAGIGCELLVTLDFTALLAPANGEMRSTFVIPNAPALIGAQFFHQMLVAEVSSAPAITLLAGSNALVATIGIF